MDVDEMLGCVYGWTWCRWYGAYWWAKLYWPVVAGPPRPRLPRARRRLGPWSGVRDGRRGRHWDRRRGRR